jgi:hypothetical protein
MTCDVVVFIGVVCHALAMLLSCAACMDGWVPCSHINRVNHILVNLYPNLVSTYCVNGWKVYPVFVSVIAASDLD